MPKNSCLIASYLTAVIFTSSHLMLVLGKQKPWPSLIPSEFPPDIAPKIHVDPDTIKLASSDYGELVQISPAAVLDPSSINDTISLIKFSFNSSPPFDIAARGRGHSIRGQAMAQNGVVINMTSLINSSGGIGIRVTLNSSLGPYADVGGEQIWIDVLQTTLSQGVAPVSWTDYLYLTVGGTLSNAGISGQTFRHGPQICNVHELDVVTGKGEFVTCSPDTNPELFYAILGGLGQFGIITRARIALAPAPKMAKWVKLLYDDFSVFSKDQEHLISMDGSNGTNALDYIEGSLFTQVSPPGSWFSPPDESRIISLVTEHGIIYCIEVAKYYDDLSAKTVDEELQELLKGLSFLPGFNFTKDVTIVDFLNRVRSEELELRKKGLWEIPHPWLNLFIPKSQILDFDSGVFKGILLKQMKNTTGGIFIVYPMNRNKWVDRMSAVIADEDTFYTAGFLHSCGPNDVAFLEDLNKQILQFCDKAGIKIKQYLPHYETKQDWINHFGFKWKSFQANKGQFDPKIILSPGQKIFSSVHDKRISSSV